MDEETRAALDLNGDQLRSMRDAGQPGVVVISADFSNVTFKGNTLGANT